MIKLNTKFRKTKVNSKKRNSVIEDSKRKDNSTSIKK